MDQDNRVNTAVVEIVTDKFDPQIWAKVLDKIREIPSVKGTHIVEEY